MALLVAQLASVDQPVRNVQVHDVQVTDKGGRMYRVATYRVDQLALPAEVILAIDTGYGFRVGPDNNIGANQPASKATRHAH